MRRRTRRRGTEWARHAIDNQCPSPRRAAQLARRPRSPGLAVGRARDRIRRVARARGLFPWAPATLLSRAAREFPRRLRWETGAPRRLRARGTRRDPGRESRRPAPHLGADERELAGRVLRDPRSHHRAAVDTDRLRSDRRGDQRWAPGSSPHRRAGGRAVSYGSKDIWIEPGVRTGIGVVV